MAWITFEYAVTRPFNLRFLNPTLLILGLIWSAFVTLVSIAAVGYEGVTVFSDTFNSTSQLWYEKIFPHSDWIPSSSVCQGSPIKIKDCYTLSSQANSSPHHQWCIFICILGVL